MMKLFTIAICLLNIILIEANEYCDLERFYCEGRPHVGCNKISNLNTDEIIELTPYVRQRVLQNLNKFRDDIAFGKRQNVTLLQVSNMNILKWNRKLELLSGDASLQLKHTEVQNLCYATSDYPEPVLILTSLNEEFEIKDISSIFIDRLVTNLIIKYSTHSALSNPSSHDIGCAITKADKLNSYSLVCILYGTEDLDYFKYGQPCSNCESLECDSINHGLCISKRHDKMSAQKVTNGNETSNSVFTVENPHIYAIYVLLGGLIVLIILMLILIKYLCQYSSHISL